MVNCRTGCVDGAPDAHPVEKATMTAVNVNENLSLSTIIEPGTQEDVVSHLVAAYAADTPTYPIGGGTSLDYGLPGRIKGTGLCMTRLNGIVDYPARDMTITVEAGITMAALAAELARHGQTLPVDAAEADRATIGGLIATNFSGPRRYGYGTLRDYVIGISAVDGRGTPFKAGGRVVKNVAGYDLCKLLTGSLGTLAAITQVTLKVRPLPEATAFLTCSFHDWEQAETLLAALINSRTTPVAIEVVCGPRWQNEPMLAVGEGGIGRLLVAFEGTATEVLWQLSQLGEEWRAQGINSINEHRDDAAQGLWQRLIDTANEGAPLTIKANLRPSSVVRFMKRLLEIDPRASLQSHAGNGIVLARFSEFSASDAGEVLVKKLQPAAIAAEGGVVVWSCRAGELTRQATWGAAPSDAALMRAVKQQFDPKGLLNPGRFIYGVP
jgi:glycolate oxidase FAD binding subunit